MAFVAAVVFLSKPVATINYCPPGWLEYDYSCVCLNLLSNDFPLRYNSQFYYNPTPLSWDDAEMACQSIFPGAHVSSPRHSSDIHTMSNARKNYQSDTPWLGLRYLNGYGWVGHANYTLPYVPWGVSPTNSEGYCAQYRPNTWTIQSRPCNELNPSFCKICKLFEMEPFCKNCWVLFPDMQVNNLLIETVAPLNGLYGGMDWFSYRRNWYQIQDGDFHNVSVVEGPNGLPASAVELHSNTESYISFSGGEQGSDFRNRDFSILFYLYRTSSSEGPILQYRYNESHYGFNIWSYSNGSMLIDLVEENTFVSVRQLYVPETCFPLNQWNFVTINYWRGNNGLLTVRNGARDTCISQHLNAFPLEMSRNFDIGRRQTPSGNIYFNGKISCLVTVETNVDPFESGETQIWCDQILKEKLVDKTMAKRENIDFPNEDNLVGMWPLNDFYRHREASGKVFHGTYKADEFGFGPQREINGSMIFNGNNTFVNLNDQPNQKMLASSFTFLRKSFSVDVWLKLISTAEGGPLFTFQNDAIMNEIDRKMLNVNIDNGNILIDIPNIGGRTMAGSFNFTNCISFGIWNRLTISFAYSTGTVSVHVNGTLCQSDNVAANTDIEAHTNIVIGRSNEEEPKFFRGKMACLYIFSGVFVGSSAVMKDNCHKVLRSGVSTDDLLYKPQHLRFFLPLGRNYQLRDISGREMHGQTSGHLGLSTGPLGHPYTAHRFHHEPNSAIDLQNELNENPYSLGTNDSVTYMGYFYQWPNRDSNLPYDYQQVFGHYDYSYGHGFEVQSNEVNMFVRLQYKNSYYNYWYGAKPKAWNSMGKWIWFVVRYSKVTRKVTVQINGETVIDETFGWQRVNTYSPMRIGGRVGDDDRLTGKMACVMMYDTDMRDEDITKAREMCHNVLIRSHGPVTDETKCYHSEAGWEYKGDVDWTASNRRCKKWSDYGNYMDGEMYSDGSLDGAGNKCRNPERKASIRSKPWCYTTDPAVEWEYCNIPVCENKNQIFHDAESTLGYWPMGQYFGGADISGHDSHGQAGDVSFTTGPDGVPLGATYFTTSTRGHYWVRRDGYSNFYDLLDLGDRSKYMDGYSYTLMVQYRSSYYSSGTVWSWESNNGDGSRYGLWMHMIGNRFRIYFCNRHYWGCQYSTCETYLNHTQWYQLSFVLSQKEKRISIYVDGERCYDWKNAHYYYTDYGLYTVTGSFKFGRGMYTGGSNIPLACGGIHSKVLTSNDMAAIRSKCIQTIRGDFNDFIYGTKKPTALWALSAHTEGLNSRGLNHARYSMLSPVTNSFGVEQGAFEFPGNNMQYFWAGQDYHRNLDVCQMTRSFTMSTYALVKGTGTAYSFHTMMSNVDDNNNAVNRGNQLTFSPTVNDIYFYMYDGSRSQNPVSSGQVSSSQWAHVTVSYDYRADNFFMYVNGQQVYVTYNMRSTYCQTSGSVSLGRMAFRPLTLSYVANPMSGALSCAQLYSSGFLSEGQVKDSQKYCIHPDMVGCYPAPNVLSSEEISNPGFWNASEISVETCRQACGKMERRFALLLNGDSCFCSDKYGLNGPEAPEGCNQPCPGNNKDICGGEKHVSVYRSAFTRAVEQPKIRSVDYSHCLPGWHHRKGNCYKVFNYRLAMEAAIAECGKFGAQLTSINEDSENRFVKAIAADGFQASDYICLGANNTVAGQSKADNMDNSPFFYANWATGQPSQHNFWTCMLYSNEMWYAQSPTSSMYFTCKKPSAPYTDGFSPLRCAPGWVRYLDSCYLFKKDQLTYRQALTECNSWHQASLVKVTSYSQFKFIQNITDYQRPFWIGLEYKPTIDAFEWSFDGSTHAPASDFSPWAGNSMPGTYSRRCAFADSRTQYDWRTAECDESNLFGFVCQYNLPSTSGFVGMASGRILDEQIRGSSYLFETTLPENARLNLDQSWCADSLDVPSASLTIELRENYTISEMWSQGNPAASQWVETAMVEVSVEHGLNWLAIESSTAVQYYDGSSWTPLLNNVSDVLALPISFDSNTITKLRFTPAMTATDIRITPLSFNGQPCLRLEFSGATLQTNDQRTIKQSFIPVRTEVERKAGSGIQYDIETYVSLNERIPRWTKVGTTMNTFESSAIYRPSHVGPQKLVYAGVDAEGNKHELSTEFSTSTRMNALEINMCPPAVLYDSYAACEFRVVGGNEIDVEVDYGFASMPPRRLKSSRVEVGSTTAPSSIPIDAGTGQIYLMPNQVVRQNGTVYAIEADIVTAGFVTIQIYRPSCASQPGTVFCAVCHCCIVPEESCVRQRMFDSYACTNNNCAKPAYFSSMTPSIDYEFVTEWRKYFTATGIQLVYLEESERIEVTLGMVMAYYKATTDSGVINVWTSDSIPEYFFLASTVTDFDNRHSIDNFTVSSTSAAMIGQMHMVKLITQTSVAVSFGRKWNSVPAGIHLINLKATDVNRPSNVLNYTYPLEVQYACTDFRLVYQPAVNATTAIPFKIPEHNGTDCQYSIDWGDGSPVTYFDFRTRNESKIHIFKIDDVYNITFTSWNMVYESKAYFTIMVVFPIQKMSLMMANPPVNELTHYSTTIMTFAQASSVWTIVDLDYNSTLAAPIGTTTRDFTPCPSGWVSGINEIGADACYRYFYTLKLNYEQSMHYCASFGGSLAYANSIGELNFLKMVMTASGGTTDQGAWVSYSRLRNGHNFWVTEEGKQSLTAPFWQETADVYPKAGLGKCGYFEYASGRLQNSDCSTVVRPMICKREASSKLFPFDFFVKSIIHS